ncbi:hypothetical protein Q7P37_010798 [Cladosporium fusiforme]
MDSASPNSSALAPDAAALKRKRSPSLGLSSANATPTAPQPQQPVAKAPKTASVSVNQLSINYLARQLNEDLPLINKDDTLPNLLSLLSSYTSILDRHESLASNLGARPLGPILIKRFERCFDAPPKIVASHHKGGASNPEDTTHHITWLEVIEFARSHPAQFTLSTFSEGRRVCQFYYPQKQLRVQISEEDFLFINSGRCQELIPPLPIWEDEEKEVGTCDVLEAKLKELTNAADMVAARTRQLGHRLKGRRTAILERRAEGGSGTPAKANALQTTTAPPNASGAAFTAVNANGRPNGETVEPSLGSSAAVKNDLLRHFEGLPQNQSQARLQSRQSATAFQDPFATSGRPVESGNAAHQDHHDIAGSTASSLSPVPNHILANDTSHHNDIARPGSTVAPPTHRPTSSNTANQPPSYNPIKHNFSRPLPPALESSQPFRPLCQAHMDSLPRGHRVLPPCDRCRRLRMDCVKNLTSCSGCTRKHARCHWRDVSREELGNLDAGMEGSYDGDGYSYANGHDDSEDDDSNPLEDLEALEEQEEGLRNARELSRMGWEEGIKAVSDKDQPLEHQPETPAINGESENHEPTSPKTVTPHQNNDTIEPETAALGAEQQALTSPRPVTGNASPGALNHDGPPPAAAAATLSEDYRPSLGGFRAVNEVGVNANTVAGWRE